MVRKSNASRTFAAIASARPGPRPRRDACEAGEEYAAIERALRPGDGVPQSVRDRWPGAFGGIGSPASAGARRRVRECPIPSCQRRLASMSVGYRATVRYCSHQTWTPAFAGVTFWGWGDGLGGWALSASPFRRLWRLLRSEEHTSELQSLMRISYAVLCLQKK